MLFNKALVSKYFLIAQFCKKNWQKHMRMQLMVYFLFAISVIFCRGIFKLSGSVDDNNGRFLGIFSLLLRTQNVIVVTI